MTRTFNKMVLFFSLLMISINSCQSNQNSIHHNEGDSLSTKNNQKNSEDEDIKSAVENLLVAAGNYNIEDLDKMTSDKAMLGISSFKDGTWSNSEIAIEDYLESISQGGRSPYCEIPNTYNITITEGRLASVVADCVLYRWGIPQTREINHFTLLKESEEWKFLNISWTKVDVAKDQKKFDLDIFAQGYARAWSSKRQKFVASYFAENGSLLVNDGDAAKGKEAISNVAESFMTRFPDMNVSYDSLVTKSEGIQFHWTLTGTDADPEGKGHKVKFSGYELWSLNNDNRIQSSKGYFSEEEYNRQLEFGFNN